MADGDFSRKIEVSARDEIGILTSAFNDMARQLKDTLDAVENERTKLSTLFLHMTDGVVAFAPDGIYLCEAGQEDKRQVSALIAPTRLTEKKDGIAALVPSELMI